MSSLCKEFEAVVALIDGMVAHCEPHPLDGYEPLRPSDRVVGTLSDRSRRLLSFRNTLRKSGRKKLPGWEGRAYDEMVQGVEYLRRLCLRLDAGEAGADISHIEIRRDGSLVVGS